MVGNIARLQLGRITKRVAENHKVPFTYDDAVVKLIVSRCTEIESGGRMIDAILTNTMLPRISQEILTQTGTTGNFNIPANWPSGPAGALAQAILANGDLIAAGAES